MIIIIVNILGLSCCQELKQFFLYRFFFKSGVSIADQEDMMSEANSRPNRLIHEKSPYLLQHAYNPVDWYPWGDEAFEKSKAENKPILLSIGYSTCHWCHVMEKESFMNPNVAELMNHNFVCIKLDREERPDLDKIYITAVSTLIGSAGWPLNVLAHLAFQWVYTRCSVSGI
jgi:thioredoxin-related protein